MIPLYKKFYFRDAILDANNRVGFQLPLSNPGSPATGPLRDRTMVVRARFRERYYGQRNPLSERLRDLLDVYHPA